MSFWKSLFGERLQISTTRFSDLSLEEAISESEIADTKAGQTRHGPTGNHRIQVAIYHRLIAIAKIIHLSENDSLIKESNIYYARARETYHGPSANYRMGKANYFLAKAIQEHLNIYNHKNNHDQL